MCTPRVQIGEENFIFVPPPPKKKRFRACANVFLLVEQGHLRATPPRIGLFKSLSTRRLWTVRTLTVQETLKEKKGRKFYPINSSAIYIYPSRVVPTVYRGVQARRAGNSGGRKDRVAQDSFQGGSQSSELLNCMPIEPRFETTG